MMATHEKMKAMDATLDIASTGDDRSEG